MIMRENKPDTREKAADGLRAPVSAEEKRRATVTETRSRLGEAHDDIFQRTNNGVPLPYALVLKKSRTTTITFDDLKAAVARSDWPKVITSSFRLFFRGTNEMEALGYFTKGVDNLDMRERLGVLRQMENADQNGMTAEQRLRTGILRAETGFLLAKDGMHFVRKAEIDGKPLKVSAGQTIAQLVDKKVLDEIRGKKIAGPLMTSDPLPEGWLHLEKRTGYPLYLTQNPNDPVPATSIYERRQDSGLKGKTEKEKRIEFLRANLKAGDLLFPNDADASQTMVRRYMKKAGRIAQAGNRDEEEFFSIHAMVYVGNGKIRHIADKGGEELSLEQLFSRKGRNYNSVAVGRFADQPKAAEFVKHIVEFSDGVKSYDTKQAISYGTQLFSRRAADGTLTPIKPTTEKLKSSTCVQMVQYAANKAGISGLKDAVTALDMFKSLKIEYAMDMM